MNDFNKQWSEDGSLPKSSTSKQIEITAHILYWRNTRWWEELHALTIPEMTSGVWLGNMGHQGADNMPLAQSARGHLCVSWRPSHGYHTRHAALKMEEASNTPWGCRTDPEEPFMWQFEHFIIIQQE